MGTNDSAQVEVYARGGALLGTYDFSFSTSTKAVADVKSLLLQDPKADYAYINWRGRRLTVTRSTQVMGARGGR